MWRLPLLGGGDKEVHVLERYYTGVTKYLISPAGHPSNSSECTCGRPSFLRSWPLVAIFTETSRSIVRVCSLTRWRVPKVGVTVRWSMLAAHSREPGTQLAFDNQNQPTPQSVYGAEATYTATVFLWPWRTGWFFKFSVLFPLSQQSKYPSCSKWHLSQCLLQFGWTQQLFVPPWVPIFFFIQRMSSPKQYTPCCLQAFLPKRQKLIVRTFCSIDGMLWLLNTYLKHQQNLFLCFDIWTSYITSGKNFESHTSTCQSWKIRDLFFPQNCFMPVSKYQVTMAIASLVNRATLPPP